MILSGTASDGTLGLKAIKLAGGITFAQEPKSAKFDGMPKSAILAGCVDFVLPPERIAKELSQITLHLHLGLSNLEKADPPVPAWDEEWMRIFKLLRDASGVDFTFYKKPTISRRVARRMALKKDRAAERVSEVPPRQPRRAGCPLSGPSDSCHQLLSGTRCFSCAAK